MKGRDRARKATTLELLLLTLSGALLLIGIVLEFGFGRHGVGDVLVLVGVLVLLAVQIRRAAQRDREEYGD